MPFQVRVFGETIARDQQSAVASIAFLRLRLIPIEKAESCLMLQGLIAGLADTSREVLTLDMRFNLRANAAALIHKLHTNHIWIM